MPMQPDSKASQVMQVLRDGPATTGEVAAELGWHVHLTCCHLTNLHNHARITRERFPTGDRRIRWLWSLPESPSGERSPQGESAP